MKKIVYRVIWAISLIILLILIICAYNQKYTRGQTNITKTYIVQPGDTLWSIAKKYTQDDPRELIFEIRRYNNITPIIRPGQIIEIPVVNRN